MIAVEITSVGRAVDSSPTETPAMMLVAWPVVLAFAIIWTGR